MCSYGQTRAKITHPVAQVKSYRHRLTGADTGKAASGTRGDMLTHKHLRPDPDTC